MCQILGSLLWFLLLFTRIQSYKLEYVERNDSLSMDLCEKIENIVHHREALSQTLDLKESLHGKWISSECEVRPGPEFLLRKYEFTKELRFVLYLYYYGDKDCRIPLYGIKVLGRLVVERSSWVVPGASENDAQVSRVDIIPYKETAASALRRKLNGICSEDMEWSTFELHNVYSQEEGSYPQSLYSKRGEGNSHGCLEGLAALFNELQLARALKRPHHHGHKWKDELFFGDIHTKIERRTRYRPTALQANPLIREQKHSIKTCRTCQRVSSSNLFNPPILKLRFFIPVNLEGEWISRRCETRPNSLFLMRRLTFIPWNRSWEGTYSYFSDEKCSEMVFKILAKGRYLRKEKSNEVDGGTEFDFKIKSAYLTPMTPSLVHQLNSLPLGSCGSLGRWSIGKTEDVTPTGGCEGLGLTIPLTELDLLKMESSHDGSTLLLSLGKTDTDAALRGGQASGKRPTSYQPPLLQCRASDPFIHKLFPVMSQLKSPPGSLSSFSIRINFPSSKICTCLLIISLLMS